MWLEKNCGAGTERSDVVEQCKMHMEMRAQCQSCRRHAGKRAAVLVWCPGPARSRVLVPGTSNVVN